MARLEGSIVVIELDDAEGWWPRVTYDGATWAVAPRYIAGAAIGGALALQNGAELPSPGLVDAIWAAATIRCDASRLVRTHNGTHAQMASAAVLEDQRVRVEMEVKRAWALDRSGQGWLLIDGTHKNIVRADRDYADEKGRILLRKGQVGLYGWHRLDGTVIQPPTPVHAKGYYDYSQGLRLVKRLA